jgi:hypothetical protein
MTEGYIVTVDGPGTCRISRRHIGTEFSGRDCRTYGAIRWTRNLQNITQAHWYLILRQGLEDVWCHQMAPQLAEYHPGGVAVMFLIRIREVLISNLIKDTAFQSEASWSSSVRPGKCCDSNWISPRLYPSKSFPSYHSSIILSPMPYDLETDGVVK